MTDPTPQTLRHYLAALAYRFEHVSANAPAGFGDFSAGAEVRSPGHIVRHMAGLVRFTHAQFEDVTLDKLEPLSWDEERARFLDSLRALDRAFARGAEPVGEVRLEQLWQGPLSDAMTHVGQLATLRRLAGSPVERVRYWQVEMPPLN